MRRAGTGGCWRSRTRWTASSKTKTQWWLRLGRCWLQRFVFTLEIGSAFDPPVAVGLDARTTCASMRGAVAVAAADAAWLVQDARRRELKLGCRAQDVAAPEAAAGVHALREDHEGLGAAGLGDRDRLRASRWTRAKSSVGISVGLRLSVGGNRWQHACARARQQARRAPLLAFGPCPSHPWGRSFAGEVRGEPPEERNESTIER